MARKDNSTTARNPGRTRGRILDAALKEFTAHGFAGARVDAVARRADINKRMLYHILATRKDCSARRFMKKIAQRVAVAGTYSRRSGRAVVRMVSGEPAPTPTGAAHQLESLQTSGNKAADEKSRRETALASIARIRQLQKSGIFNGSLDPAFALLAMMSLCVFPTSLFRKCRA